LFPLLAAALRVAAAAAQQYIPTVTREIKLLQELYILFEYANCAISNRFSAARMSSQLNTLTDYAAANLTSFFVP
jgi:hypothetical protein